MGAYLPLRNGSREFITDMDTYEERYQQEWAEELKQQEEEKKLRQEESPFGSGILKEFKDKGFFKLDEKGEVMKGDDPWTKEVETDKIQFAPTVLDDIPIPVQKKMIGMGKMTTHALSNVVNFPFALHDLAKTQGALPYQQIHDLFKSEEQKEKDQQVSMEVFDSLLKTGKKPDGSSYGIQKDWGPLGEMFSPDSDLQKMLRPTSFWGKLGADIMSAFTFEGGVRGLSKTVPNIVGGVTTKQLSLNLPKSYGVWKGITERNLKQVYQGASSWFLKEGLYELGLDMMFIRPDIPESWHKRIDEIQQVASPEDRINMMKMIAADTDEEFNLAAETIKEWPMTLGSMVLLRGLFKTANWALRDVSTKGTNPKVALDNASKKVAPEVLKEIEPIAKEKVSEGIEVQLGKINTEMNRLIDQSAANIAYGTREGAQSYINKKSALSEGVPSLEKRFKETEPLVENVKEIDSQIEEIQKKYAVKTEAQIAKKIKDQNKRVKAYESEIRKNPNWIKSRSNKAKYNKASNAAKNLQILQELRKARGSMVVEQKGLLGEGDVFDLRQGISEELESIFDQIDEGQVGFNNAINDATILIKRLEELDIQRRELLRAKGLSSEIDLQFPGVNGFVMRKLRQIINDVGVARAAGNLNDKYMNKVVQEIDELHHRLIGKGGMAPVVPEQPEALNIPGDTKKIEKLTGDLEDDPWLSGADEVVEETTKKGAAEVVEEGVPAAEKTIDAEVSVVEEGTTFKGGKYIKRADDPGKLSLPEAIEEVGEVIPEIKKKGWKKLLRTLPEGQQAEVAIDRIIAAWDKFEKGVSAKNRMFPVSTVGDLARFLNIVRVMIEEGTQKGLRDVERTLAAYDKLTLSPTGRRRNLQEWFPGMKGLLKAGRDVKAIQKGKKPDPRPSLFGTTPETQKALPPIKEDGRIPKEPSPVEIEAPITTDKSGNAVVDGTELANRRAAAKPFRGEGTKAKQRRTIQRKKKAKLEEPTTEFDAQQKLNKLEQGIANQRARAEAYLKENPGDFKGASEIFSRGTTGRLYNSNEEAVEAFVGNIKAYRTPNKKTLGAEMIKAAKLMSTVVGEEQSVVWERFMMYAELEDIAQNISEKFHMVTAGVSMIEETTNAVLREASNLNKYFGVERGIVENSLADAANQAMIDGKLVTKQEAMDRFVLAWRNFDKMLSATERTFYAAGNLLGILKDEFRIKVAGGKTSPIFNEVNKELFERFGTEEDITKAFTENLQKADKQLGEKLNPTFKKLMEGERLTQEELQGFQMFVDKVRRTNGDITKLKEVDLSGDAILARLQTQNPLSTMHAPFNLPLQGLVDMNFQLFSRMWVMAGDSAFSRWILKDIPRARESWKDFLWARDTMLVGRYSFNQGLQDSYYRFLLGKNIADAGQMSNRAYKISQGGVVREQAILDDLAATEIRLPLVNWVLDKNNMNKKVFNLLNNTRVGMKVFHDYAIPGEAWKLRSGVGKLMGASTTAIRGLTGLGTKSYYPGGQEVNMTLWGQLFAAGDEMISSMYANSSVQARVTQNVRDMLAQKLAKGDLRLEDIPREGSISFKKELVKEMKALYADGLISDVTAGYNNQTIGKAIVDKQIHELTQIANRTEELKGIRADAQKMIQLMTKSENQYLRWFGREIAPITVSPLNEMKKIIMISSGGEMLQFTGDMALTAAKKLEWDKKLSNLKPLNIPVIGKELDKYAPQWADKLKNFQSKYTNEKISIRGPAQTALAWSISLNAAIFALTLDGEQEITGNKFHTYKSDRFHKKSYIWTVGGVEIPYRYLGLLGSTMALHANMRDAAQFGSSRADANVMTMAVIMTANTLLDTPQSQGFQQINRVLEAAANGDPWPAQKMVSKAIEKASSPHMTARRQIIQGLLPNISSRPEARFGKGWKEKGKLWMGSDKDQNIVTAALTNAANLAWRSQEHDLVGLMANLVFPIATGALDGEGKVDEADSYYKSRQAVWYGVPGEPFQSEYTGAAMPLKTILGRNWAFPNKLNDPVNAAMSLYLIKGADQKLYASKGYGNILINDRVLNDFNHYLQNEYQEYSLDGKTLLTGTHAMFLETIKSPYFQAESTDPTSPYKMPTPAMPWFLMPLFKGALKPDVNWNRADNPKRRLLQNRRDTILKGAKESWFLQSIKHYNGELNLKFPMPKEMVERIQLNRPQLDFD